VYSYWCDVDETNQEPGRTDPACHDPSLDAWPLVTENGDETTGQGSSGSDPEREQHQKEENCEELGAENIKS
jgi:hypothetical protein